MPNEISWEWLGQVRLEEEVTLYLVNMFVHNGVIMTCDGWNRLFRIQESVYQELCWEFFSAINFHGGNNYYD